MLGPWPDGRTRRSLSTAPGPIPARFAAWWPVSKRVWTVGPEPVQRRSGRGLACLPPDVFEGLATGRVGLPTRYSSDNTLGDRTPWGTWAASGVPAELPVGPGGPWGPPGPGRRFGALGGWEIPLRRGRRMARPGNGGLDRSWRCRGQGTPRTGMIHGRVGAPALPTRARADSRCVTAFTLLLQASCWVIRRRQIPARFRAHGPSLPAFSRTRARAPTQG